MPRRPSQSLKKERTMNETPLINPHSIGAGPPSGGPVQVHAGVPGGKSMPKQPRFSVTPAKLWTAFLFRWKLAITIGLLLASIGVGVAVLTYKPKYTAVATMRMISSKPRILPGAQDDAARNSAREVDFQKTQAQLIKSPDLLASVLESNNIRGMATVRQWDDPSYWLEKELQAGFIPGTDICRIWLSGENPAEIADIVNMTQKIYVAQFESNSQSQQANHLTNIAAILAKADDDVKIQRNQLKDLAERLKTNDTKVLTTRQEQMIKRFNHLDDEVTRLESEHRATVAFLSVLAGEKTKLESEKPSPDVLEEYMLGHPQVQKQQYEVAQIESQLKDYSKRVTPSNPGLLKLQEELKAAQNLLQKIKSDIQPELLLKIRNYNIRQHDAKIEQMNLKRNVLYEQHKEVQKKALNLGQEVEHITKGVFEIENRRNALGELESTTKKLREQKQNLEIELLNTRKLVDMVHPAAVPTINQASLFRLGSLYSLAGLMIGLLGVSYLEARLHRVHQSGDIVQELGIQTLGILPLLEKNTAETYGRAQLSEESLSSILFKDAVNGLCTRLLCDDRLSRSAVLMLTSANEDEGKTLLATQIAAGLAHAGRRTLLLDCDFRKPRCHQQLGLAAGPGLSEVLAGTAQLTDVLQTLPDSEARFLSAGKPTANVIKSLSNGEFAALLKHLRKDFDCIILDSAPTLAVSDGLLLGKLADGVLMVVRSKSSKAPAVFAAFEQLAALRIPTLGAVVNGAPAGVWSRYYLR
jgi:succinoglycan biosynthesis transport protein ExoP